MGVVLLGVGCLFDCVCDVCGYFCLYVVCVIWRFVVYVLCDGDLDFLVWCECMVGVGIGDWLDWL